MAAYVATDLHGMYNLWQGIKDYLKPNDTLYYLGDAIDRGPRGWDIFTELLDDPRVVYIKGNHEEMMYNTFNTTGVIGTKIFNNWCKNGGNATLENIKERKLSVTEKFDYIDKIKDLSTYAIYANDNGQFFILTHAGCTPNEKYFNMTNEDFEYYNIWNRKHFSESWPKKDYDNVYVIHGHTPVQLMHQIDKKFEKSIAFPIVYCDGHKINLDSAAFYSNCATLYNLDENKIEMIFKGE